MPVAGTMWPVCFTARPGPKMSKFNLGASRWNDHMNSPEPIGSLAGRGCALQIIPVERLVELEDDIDRLSSGGVFSS